MWTRFCFRYFTDGPTYDTRYNEVPQVPVYCAANIISRQGSTGRSLTIVTGTGKHTTKLQYNRRVGVWFQERHDVMGKLQLLEPNVHG